MTWFIFPQLKLNNKETNNKWVFHHQSLAFEDNINLQLKFKLALPKKRISASKIDIDKKL